jgi:hypothetical protein
MPGNGEGIAVVLEVQLVRIILKHGRSEMEVCNVQTRRVSLLVELPFIADYSDFHGTNLRDAIRVSIPFLLDRADWQR